jgi:hypothetical protein
MVTSRQLKRKLGKKTMVLGIVLIVVLSVSIIASIESLENGKSTPEFFVGVEFAYASDNVTGLKGLVSDLRGMVDTVKNYTNLFIIGNPEITLNQTVLNETCDYIYAAGLHFIVFFTSTTSYLYNPYVWIIRASQKYGDRFLGAYRIDEPGGKQLDNSKDRFVLEAKNNTDAAKNYVEVLYEHLEYWTYSGAKIFTSDYGLYWFDYKAGYNTVLAQFGSNLSRPISVGLCRGAAKAHDKDWGAIITWTYDKAPYMEPAENLYADMTLAYKAGAKYVVVFDYPKIGRYGTLTDAHLDAMKNFWNYVHSNPEDHGVDRGEAAYVLPQDHGFGFRSANDNTWGFWNADQVSRKMWNDANTLVNRYGSRLDIVYDEPEFSDYINSRYAAVFFWNETVT